MAKKQRVLRAVDLVYHLDKLAPAAAWRAVNPSARCKDASAERAVRRELEFLASYIFNEVSRSPAARRPKLVELERKLYELRNRSRSRSAPAEEAPTRMCLGTATKRCRKQLLPKERKRCRKCAAEQRRLDRKLYNKDYHAKHREGRNEKRREHDRQKRQGALLAEVLAERARVLAEAEAVIRAAYEARATELRKLDYKPGEFAYMSTPAMGDAGSLLMPSGETIEVCLQRLGLDPQVAQRVVSEIVRRVTETDADGNPRMPTR